MKTFDQKPSIKKMGHPLLSFRQWRNNQKLENLRQSLKKKNNISSQKITTKMGMC